MVTGIRHCILGACVYIYMFLALLIFQPVCFSLILYFHHTLEVQLIRDHRNSDTVLMPIFSEPQYELFYTLIDCRDSSCHSQRQL